VVIDDDLGRSGGGIARPGFERLLLAICEGRAGIVLAVEASRLARNGRDWHTLLEFCGLVGCLLADEGGRLTIHVCRMTAWLARHEGHHERDGAVVSHASARSRRCARRHAGASSSSMSLWAM
jgi:Resolvase, N terminal domain